MGSPSNPSALGAAIVSAYNAGYRTITINPGTYNVPDISSPMCSANNWSNVTISAYGVTIVETDAVNQSDIFDFYGCTNVTLKGPTLSVSVEPCMQGHVTAIGPTASDGDETLDVSFDNGYPAPSTTGANWFDGVDQTTGFFKVGSTDYGNSTVTVVSGGIDQVDFGVKTVPMVVGDVIFGRSGNTVIKVRFNNCTNCTFQDGIMYRSGFASCFENEGPGPNHYLNVKWQPGPAPVSGGYVPVFCAAADGLHSVDEITGPDIENCSFQGLLQDDVIAIQGGYQKITAASGTSFTVNGGYAYLGNGVAIRVAGSGYYQEGVISNYVSNANGTATFTLSTSYTGPNPATNSVGVFNPGRCGAGYKLLNNTLGGTRSRIVIAKADNGLMQNNIMSGSLGAGSGAVLIGDDGNGGGEAGFVHNVTIKNNTISNVVNGPAVSVINASNAMGNENITIANNLIEFAGPNPVSISGCNTATVSGNTFIGPCENQPGYLVSAYLSQAITLSGNLISEIGQNYYGNFTSTSTTGTNGATNGVYDTDTTYNITLPYDDMVVCDPGSGGAGAQLIQYPANATYDNQWWQLVPVESQPGYFTMVNMENGLYASVSDDSAGSAVTLEDESVTGGVPSSTQLWQLVPVDSVNVNVVNQSSGYCINVDNNSTEPSAPLCQWYTGSAENQNCVPVSLLPANWVDMDIGGPGLTGNATCISPGVWDVAGSGADIWNNSDQFNYAEQPVTVDGSMVAEVTSITDTNVWAKAGVMFRNTTDPGSMFVDVLATEGEGVTMQWRNATNGSCVNNQISSVPTPTPTAPVWVKVVKAGTTFTGYYSLNGTTWTQIATTTITYPYSPYLVGLAVASHDNTKLNAATFSKVNYAQLSMPPGSYLTQGQYLVSPNGQYILVQQSDSNLVLYSGTDPQHEGSVIWSSDSTQPSGLYYTTLQTDGNLVTYAGTPLNKGAVEWAAGTYGMTVTSVQMTNAPEIQILNGTTVVKQYP